MRFCRCDRQAGRDRAVFIEDGVHRRGNAGGVCALPRYRQVGACGDSARRRSSATRRRRARDAAALRPAVHRPHMAPAAVLVLQTAQGRRPQRLFLFVERSCSHTGYPAAPSGRNPPFPNFIRNCRRFGCVPSRRTLFPEKQTAAGRLSPVCRRPEPSYACIAALQQPAFG